MSLYAFGCEIMRSYVFVLLPMCTYAILESTPEKAFSRLALGFCLPDERPYLFHLPNGSAGAKLYGLGEAACFAASPPGTFANGNMGQNLGQPDKAFLWQWALLFLFFLHGVIPLVLFALSRAGCQDNQRRLASWHDALQGVQHSYRKPGRCSVHSGQAGVQSSPG